MVIKYNEAIRNHKLTEYDYPEEVEDEDREKVMEKKPHKKEWVEIK